MLRKGFAAISLAVLSLTTTGCTPEPVRIRDFTRSVQQTSDGGFIAAGYTETSGPVGGFSFFPGPVPSSLPPPAEILVFKLDSSGRIVWKKAFGGSGDDKANSVQQTSDGGFIVAGYTSSYGAGKYNGTSYADALFLRLDSSGNIIWKKTFSGNSWDVANSVQQTPDGGFVVAGGTSSFGTGEADLLLLKLDSSGNVVWKKTFGEGDYSSPNFIGQTSDGGFVVTGRTTSFVTGHADAFLLRLDSSGNIAWKKILRGNSDNQANSVQQTSDGGFIIAGYTYSFGAGSRDSLLLKVDSSGNIAWKKIFGGRGDDQALFAQQTSNGGFIIAGHTDPYSDDGSEYGPFVLKLDPSGNMVWKKAASEGISSSVNFIGQTPDGGFIVAGDTWATPDGTPQLFLIKLDPSGNIVSKKLFEGRCSTLIDIPDITVVEPGLSESSDFSLSASEPATTLVDISSGTVTDPDLTVTDICE